LLALLFAGYSIGSVNGLQTVVPFQSEPTVV